MFCLYGSTMSEKLNITNIEQYSLLVNFQYFWRFRYGYILAATFKVTYWNWHSFIKYLLGLPGSSDLYHQRPTVVSDDFQHDLIFKWKVSDVSFTKQLRIQRFLAQSTFLRTQLSDTWRVIHTILRKSW